MLKEPSLQTPAVANPSPKPKERVHLVVMEVVQDDVRKKIYVPLEDRTGTPLVLETDKKQFILHRIDYGKDFHEDLEELLSSGTLYQGEKSSTSA